MLEFINNNGVLFSGLFSIIVALISVLVTVIRDCKKSKNVSIKSLQKELNIAREELKRTKAELIKVKSNEEVEKNIDKAHGSIYYESLSNECSRTICGFCWEKHHIKIPIVVEMCYDEYSRQYYYSGYCNSCKTHCIENIEPIVNEAPDFSDVELPF